VSPGDRTQLGLLNRQAHSPEMLGTQIKQKTGPCEHSRRYSTLVVFLELRPELESGYPVYKTGASPYMLTEQVRAQRDGALRYIPSSSLLVRADGVEPPFTESESGVLPIGRSPIIRSGRRIRTLIAGTKDQRPTFRRSLNIERARGIEPLASVWKTEVLPLYEARVSWVLRESNPPVSPLKRRVAHHCARRPISCP
jgi:hypothetical protein